MSNKSENNVMEMWRVNGGSFFKIDEKVCLKTGEPPSGGCYLAVELDGGELVYVDKDHPVELTPKPA